MTSDVWWYYMVELGFYTSLTFSQFMDIKRKDFAQMFVHHIVTILLLVFSWSSNLTRIGTIVLIVHDFADCPLEAAKMAKYIHKQRLGDMLFVVFTLAWIVSRLGLYPYRYCLLILSCYKNKINSDLLNIIDALELKLV
ncbi:ceramide synthase 6-like [Centruroides sculpturatus]|uniref:ceramide synthase 6-like n=1 Tax=Centruroides sculpturatus TaxID=218467 RepID=UPI000C6E336D|nr:ceramide synthase 6-like [Centruroides sculpturatus]